MHPMKHIWKVVTHPAINQSPVTDTLVCRETRMQVRGSRFTTSHTD